MVKKFSEYRRSKYVLYPVQSNFYDRNSSRCDNGQYITNPSYERNPPIPRQLPRATRSPVIAIIFLFSSSPTNGWYSRGTKRIGASKEDTAVIQALTVRARGWKSVAQICRGVGRDTPPICPPFLIPLLHPFTEYDTSLPFDRRWHAFKRGERVTVRGYDRRG